jgi:hypothetical protein
MLVKTIIEQHTLKARVGWGECHEPQHEGGGWGVAVGVRKLTTIYDIYDGCSMLLRLMCTILL